MIGLVRGKVKIVPYSYEWKELYKQEENTYSRTNFLLHMHFIEKYLHKGMKIFDAGCGAGRYSIEFAKRGQNICMSINMLKQNWEISSLKQITMK